MLDAYDHAQLKLLSKTLGPRFTVKAIRPTYSQYEARVVEGADETIYMIDADSIEQLCGKILLAVVRDKTRPAPNEDVVFSNDALRMTGTFRASGSWLIRKDLENSPFFNTTRNLTKPKEDDSA